MSKKIVMVSSSYRKGGNSETLIKEFARGAKTAGNEVEIIYLREYEIKYCLGCLTCQKTGKCIIQDGVKRIIEKVKNADILVFATPIYYYSVSGQLKTFLDRMNPLYSQNFKYRDIYLLTTAADEDPLAMEIAIKEMEAWIKCFKGVKLNGVIRGTDATNIGDIQKKEDILQQAYTMGREV